MRTAVRVLSAAFVTLALALPVLADAAMTMQGKPKISFFATGSPGFMSIEGVSSTMTVKDDGQRITFSVPMSTVDSGISLRDEHMNNNYVQIDKFPNAVIDLARADVKWPQNAGEAVDGTVTANFTIHGVTKPVTVSYNNARTKTGWRVKAKFDYNVNDHGIFIEPYMGISFDAKMYATVTVDLADVP